MDRICIDICIYTHMHLCIYVHIPVTDLPVCLQLFVTFIKINCPPAQQYQVTYKYVWWHLALLKAAPFATIPRSERRSQVGSSALTWQGSWGISPWTSYHRTCSLAHCCWVRAERLWAAFINTNKSSRACFQALHWTVKIRWAPTPHVFSMCCAERH